MRKLPLAVKLELIGVALILLSAGFALFVSDRLSSSFFEESFSRVDDKLDYTWATVADLYTHSEHNKSSASSSINMPLLFETWDDRKTVVEVIRERKNLYSTISGLIFLLGGLVSLLGKYLRERELVMRELNASLQR